MRSEQEGASQLVFKPGKSAWLGWGVGLLFFSLFCLFCIAKEAREGAQDFAMALSMVFGIPLATGFSLAALRLTTYRVELRLNGEGWVLLQWGLIRKRRCDLACMQSFRLRKFSNAPCQIDFLDRHGREYRGFATVLGGNSIDALANVLGGIEDAERRVGQWLELSPEWR